jgi:hypothetical protein
MTLGISHPNIIIEKKKSIPIWKICVPSLLINITIINVIMNNYYDFINKINEKITFHKSNCSF